MAAGNEHGKVVYITESGLRSVFLVNVGLFAAVTVLSIFLIDRTAVSVRSSSANAKVSPES